MPPAVSTSRPTPECVPQPGLEVEVMLADQLDYVVGVDPHRDSHALAVVHVVGGAVLFEAAVDANSDGYAHALKLVAQHAPGRRAFAVEGTGSFGAGLTRFLTGRGERVLEVGRLRRERRSGGKTDALDAVRAARSALSQQQPSTPRAGGERQALQALVAAREGAVNAKRAGLCQLRDLLITTPEPARFSVYRWVVRCCRGCGLRSGCVGLPSRLSSCNSFAMRSWRVGLRARSV